MNNSTRANVREMFLDALMDGFSVSRACERADIDRKTAYNWRKAESEFAEAWDDALEAGTDKLEDEAFRRAHDGVSEPLVGMGKIVLDKDGNPLTVQKYSDGLLTTLLKARRPDKYKDRVASEVKAEVSVDGDAAFAALARKLDGIAAGIASGAAVAIDVAGQGSPGPDNA